VVSWTLALAHPGLLPSGPLHAVGFLPLCGIILLDHHSTYFGAQYTAWTLDPSGFGLPFPGMPADISTDLLARR